MRIRSLHIIFVTVLLFLGNCAPNNGERNDQLLFPAEIRCEYTDNPLGLETQQPRFSWILTSAQRGQMQTAYQILVASSLENLTKEKGDKWDSEKLTSDQSVNVVYHGKELSSSEKCWWKVRVWDKDGKASVFSEPATFEMGLLKERDWQGNWIAAADPLISAPLLRKEFEITKKVKRARAYISGLGYNELYVNGKKVSDHVLDPATTYYNNDQPFELGSRVLYVPHDINDYLKSGQNAVGVMLGNGWYSAEDDIPPSPSFREPYGERPILILQINIEFTDGETMSIVTDNTWKTSGGPILYNDYCNGETYDARLEKSGWNSPGYDDSGWSEVQYVDPPGGKMVSQIMPPVKVIETIKPVRILNPDQNVYVYDMGQNFSGWTRIRVSGPESTKLTLRHGARVYEDGSLDARSSMHNCPDSEEDYLAGKPGNGKGFHHCARQSDTYILKGGEEEVWEPRFTLHGFRYVELSGFPGIPTLETLEGRFVRSAVETVGHFTCSSDLINKIHHNITWSFMCSMQGFPQDAADRSERVGWLGDPIPEDFMLNYNTALYWRKWTDDLHDSQKQNGDLPVICPLHWRRTWDAFSMMPCWKSTYPIVAWDIYRYYNDERILEEHYEGIKKLVAFLRDNSINQIISQGLGDHMEPQPGGWSSETPKHTPPVVTSTAIYYNDAWIAARAAEILGKPEEARYYSELAETIKEAFNKELLDKRTNQYATGSQTSNAIPLLYKLVPQDRVDAVLKNLIDDIIINHNGHLSTGILGTNALSQVLSRYGRADIMYTIATQTTFPGWGEQVLKGATTLYEAWEGETEPQLSYNMKMFGSVEKFFYEGLAGINLAAPGFKRIIIKPNVVGDLTFVKASINTVRGLIAVDWKRGDRSLDMKVILPPNSMTRVSVPKMQMENVTITESGNLMWKEGSYVGHEEGITGGTENKDYVTFDVGSGIYVFRLSGQPK